MTKITDGSPQQPGCLRRLPEIMPRSGLDDPQFDRRCRIHQLPRCFPDEPESLLRPAERPLAVGHHRQVVGRSGHPPQRAVFTQGDVVFPCRISGFGGALADDRQPGRAATGRIGVGVGELRVLVDQLAREQQVPGDDLCQILGQAAQLRPDATIQSADVGIYRDLRLGALRFKAGREPPLGLTMIIAAAISAWTIAARTISARTITARTITATTIGPTTIGPTTIGPTTIGPTTIGPTTIGPTTIGPTTIGPTTIGPTTITAAVTIAAPIIAAPVITAPVIVTAAVRGTGVRARPARALPRGPPAVEGRSTRAAVVAVVVGPIATATLRPAGGGTVSGTR
ncbi:hypothetical protein [Microlunatus endophyticus]